MVVWNVFLSPVKLSPHRLTIWLIIFGIWSLIRFPAFAGSSIQSSTSKNKHQTLYLNIFRGEPAISGFDWHFTTIHKSSQSFATLYGSGLPRTFRWSSPCSWIDHPVSGLVCAVNALLRLGFPTPAS